MNEFLGVRVTNDQDATEFDVFNVEDILFIDSFSPKRGYKVPRFHTTKGIFTVLLTLEECKKALDLNQFDIGIIGFFEKIDYVKETPFALTAYFKNSPYTANIAKSRRDLVKHLIV